jgi:hypothetical protein
MALALAACATPSPTPSGATSLPTASPGSEVLDLTTIPMFVDNPLLAGDRMMKVGFADGRITRELALTRTEERWYADSWMTGGRVAYAVSDPDLTEIHVITAATGDISTFEVEGHPAITALILAPDGGSAFYVGWQRRVPYLQGNSVLEAGTGVWRLDLSVDAVPVRILPPATPTSGSPFWLDGEVDSALFIASDGGTLVATDSVGTGAARIRVVDFATGSTVDRSTEAIVYPQGVSGRDLVGVSANGGSSFWISIPAWPGRYWLGSAPSPYNGRRQSPRTPTSPRTRRPSCTSSMCTLAWRRLLFGARFTTTQAGRA